MNYKTVTITPTGNENEVVYFFTFEMSDGTEGSISYTSTPYPDPQDAWVVVSKILE